VLKQFAAVFMLICAGLSGTCTAQTGASKWNIKKSDHFIVYYRDARLEDVSQIIEYAERYYDNITSQLGFTRFEGFWTWDARVKVYLYNTRGEYVRETKHSEWSGAHINIITRELYAYLDMADFLGIILPHELGHIVFRERVGFKRELPLWLDEGVVSYLEKDQKQERLMVAKAVAKTSYFVPLAALNKVRPGIGMMPDVFYAEAASIIEFLIATYGKDKFYEFCERLKSLRFDQDWFDAARETYYFENIGDMNKKWISFLNS
jgi:hypothetical protein